MHGVGFVRHSSSTSLFKNVRSALLAHAMLSNCNIQFMKKQEKSLLSQRPWPGSERHYARPREYQLLYTTLRHLRAEALKLPGRIILQQQRNFNNNNNKEAAAFTSFIFFSRSPFFSLHMKK